MKQEDNEAVNHLDYEEGHFLAEIMRTFLAEIL